MLTAVCAQKKTLTYYPNAIFLRLKYVQVSFIIYRYSAWIIELGLGFSLSDLTFPESRSLQVGGVNGHGICRFSNVNPGNRLSMMGNPGMPI